jgi:UDP-GlcNAc:undecaprenyl-phosphate/decaprenyl-phosphate GlcNAc-1-phosphate transferase
MFNIFFAFITALSTSLLAIPSIIRVARVKHLFDEPDSIRKKHSTRTPTLGGMGIFAGLIFSLTFWSNQSQILELQYIIAAIIILFFIGLKDDVLDMKAHKKLLGQLIAAFIIVHWAEIRLTTFYGLFDIHEISLVPSYLLSLFVLIVITNSFNLIDGIDGLAGSIGVISSTTFGIWFTLMESYQYSILAYALAGTLIAFLWFNWSPAKIFMGDTGSLIVGLVISLLAIKFIEMNRVMDREAPYKVLSVPVVTIGILIVPLFDTIRVFALRFAQGRSPFSADRNHIHHILIDLGFSHSQATIVICLFNLSVIALVYFLQGVFSGEVLLMIVLLMPLSVTYELNRRRKHKTMKL